MTCLRLGQGELPPTTSGVQTRAPHWPHLLGNTSRPPEAAPTQALPSAPRPVPLGRGHAPLRQGTPATPRRSGPRISTERAVAGRLLIPAAQGQTGGDIFWAYSAPRETGCPLPCGACKKHTAHVRMPVDGVLPLPTDFSNEDRRLNAK